MFKINKTFIIAPLALLFFAVLYTNVPFIHAATDTYIPLAPLPGAAPAEGTNFASYVKGLFALLIGIAAVLAVIMIMIGGIEYISSAAVGGKSDGKEKVTQALYGLFLTIACWLILYTVNPNLLNFDILTTTPAVTVHEPGYWEPTTPGWYVKYYGLCPSWNVWTLQYHGPVDETSCNTLNVPVQYCEPVPPSTTQTPMFYSEKSCVQIPTH